MTTPDYRSLRVREYDRFHSEGHSKACSLRMAWQGSECDCEKEVKAREQG